MAEDLAEVAARFGAALRQAGLPVGPGRCERFAAAVTLARPQTPRALYLCAVATLVSSQAHIATLEMVFIAVFGGLDGPAGMRDEQDVAALSFLPPGTPEDMLAGAARAAREHASRPRPEAGQPGERPETGPGPEQVIEHRFLGSAAERLAAKDFAELSPDELLDLAASMRQITLAVPLRRSRRQRRRHGGPRMDMRSTLRQARRTGGDPVSLTALAEAMIEANGGGKYDIRECPRERKRIDVGDFLIDDQRFRDLSGWRPRVGIARGLRRCLEYYRNHLASYI